MSSRRLFVPSPAPRDDVGRRTRSSSKPEVASPLKQSTLSLSGYSVQKTTRGATSEASPPLAKKRKVHSSEDSSRPLSASPEPARLPSDFLQVTNKSFLNDNQTAIPGVHYLPRFLPEETANDWYESLVDLPQWYRPTLKMYGREIVQSRSIIAFSKVPDLKLKYSGTEVDMHPWPDVLRKMEHRCRNVIGKEVKFNHAMLNYYPSGDTHIGRHSDNLENKVILTVSLGSPRTWIMTKRPMHGAKAAAKRQGEALPKMESHRWTVENGSLLLMQGDTQKEWYHEIPKQAKIKQGRISITFRQLVYD
ncbi:unnamed protein product [Sympodiomycopsis kandeliae]